MLYKKIFEQSGFTNQEIVNKLKISHTERMQFEKTSNINLNRLIFFAKALGFKKKEVAKIVFKEVSNKY